MTGAGATEAAGSHDAEPEEAEKKNDLQTYSAERSVQITAVDEPSRLRAEGDGNDSGKSERRASEEVGGISACRVHALVVLIVGD